jgi:signal transduction histidine kinase
LVPQKVRFRYKLEGHDADWQEPGTRRQAFYSDLSPGKYQFRVTACNNDGVWSEQAAKLSFIVAPAWYQTNWFRLLCVFSGLFLAWSIYQLRLRQIAASISARFDERLAERTRMAREFHDTLLQTIQGSKMVADDALDESADLPRMRRAMERVSGWLGQATQEGRSALNALRSSTTQTNDLAESFRRALDDCRIQGFPEVAFLGEGTAEEMHPIVRDEIYRIGY